MYLSPEAPPSTTPTTLVLIDPTDPNGESALDMLTDEDRHITLVVLLWDRGGAALRTWADEERIGLAEAATMYLEQVTERLNRPAGSVSFEVCGGSNAHLELAMLAKTVPVLRTLRPGTTLPEAAARSSIRDRVAERFGKSAPSLLDNSALARKVPAAEVATLDRLGSLRSVPAATRLMSEGLPGTEVCVVVEGSLAVERAGVRIAELGPGEVAGEISLLTGAPCNADVVTTADTEVIALNDEAFTEVLDNCPRLAGHLLRTSVQRLAAA